MFCIAIKLSVCVCVVIKEKIFMTLVKDSKERVPSVAQRDWHHLGNAGTQV